jgi:hypothetical protein
MAKDTVIGPCAFCTTDSKLCDSHIQPRWLYRERGTDFKLISSTHDFELRRPIGPYEKLLCLKCEGTMGVYDDYSAEFFKGCKTWPRDLRTNWCAVYQYDYAKLKLFALSMLWRAGVASQEFYSMVQLDTATMADLHDMIEKEDPGLEQDYSVMISMREATNGLENIGWNPAIKQFRDNLKWCTFDLNQFRCDIKISRETTNFDDLFLLKPAPPLLIVTGPIFQERVSKFQNHSLDQQERERKFRESHPKKKPE